MVGRHRERHVELELRGQLAHRLLVGGAARSPPPSCRPGRGTSAIGEPFLTSSLVPETNIVGEKPTSFWRSRLFVVDPHSRSTWPEVTAAMRDSDVTGSHLMATVRPTSSPIASTTSLHRSIE